MNVTIDLPPDQARQLTSRAVAQGQDLAGYIQRVLEADLAAQPPAAPSPNRSTIELLARWDEEDETDDADELDRRRQETEALMQALDRNREAAGSRKLFP